MCVEGQCESVRGRISTEIIRIQLLHLDLAVDDPAQTTVICQLWVGFGWRQG